MTPPPALRAEPGAETGNAWFCCRVVTSAVILLCREKFSWCPS